MAGISYLSSKLKAVENIQRGENHEKATAEQQPYQLLLGMA